MASGDKACAENCFHNYNALKKKKKKTTKAQKVLLYPLTF